MSYPCTAGASTQSHALLHAILKPRRQVLCLGALISYGLAERTEGLRAQDNSGLPENRLWKVPDPGCYHCIWGS